MKRLTDNVIEADSLCWTDSLKRLTLNDDTDYLDSTVSQALSKSVWLRLADIASYSLEDVEAQIILTQLIHKLSAFCMTWVN